MKFTIRKDGAGEWVAFCPWCGIGELRSSFEEAVGSVRAGIKFHMQERKRK